MKKDKAHEAAVRTRAHLLIVEARFYAGICDELVRGATGAITRAGATYERVTVPGSLEVPGAIAIAAAKTKRFDGFVALGCVLRGETSHYDIVANESARGLLDLTMKGLCIGNGILTCENEDQAMARAKAEEMDKGGGAAEASLAMIRLKRTIGRKGRGS
jgi:6,7-dimethyl-8-ribityllumazine synthase